ncbi:uncharacterized protein N7482_000487 [Penicillium canariense]|uniref:SET domain-containing protein n=1 Tax=Penicillium canariense TaxID=189055 RepID=A0A9W9IEM5_9EURO|nr:uncharacterized protein N7482_000487 [Penicillium canariense]KAJ5174610.1 hypothetical protein N7482_000487 [Penicillium canariense]
MDVHDVSSVPQYLQVLQGHRRTLQNAQSKKGQRPRAMKSREEILGQFLYRQMMNKTPAGNHIRSAFVPPVYPPSVSPLSDLKKIMIKDLTLETHHRGSFILLRALSTPDVMTAIMLIVEDEENRVLMLQLYHQGEELATKYLTQGSVMIVKEPYLKVMADGDNGIRVDQLSDVRFIPPYDDLVPLSWRERVTEDDTTANDWKMAGNDFFNKGHHLQAIESYSKALECVPTAEETLTIKLNRALAFLKRHQLNAALHDLDGLSSEFSLFQKVLFRKSEALYQLQRFRECCDVSTTLVKQYPDNKSANDVLTKAITRLLEQQRGKYQFKQLQREAATDRPPHLDHATYVGPVSVRPTEAHGRGLFTTEAVKAGDLLFCEKAFAYVYHDADNPTQGLSLLMNAEQSTIIMGTHADLLSLIIQKLYQTPSLISTVTDLYHGSYKPVDISEVDGTPIVDTFLIERIMALNGFGCPLSSYGSHRKFLFRERMVENAKKFDSCGLWPLASSINHSCYSNVRRSFIGDMMIVRATQDLAPNTELNFWYKSPQDSERDSYSKGRKADLPHWGFQCSCVICQDALNTPSKVLQKREKLMAELRQVSSSQNRNLVRFETILSKIAETYSQPPSRVPCFSLWDPYLSLALTYSTQDQPQKVIVFGLKALESLGYIVEGGHIPITQGMTLVVKKWGLAVDSLVPCWMTLANAYRKVAPDLEDQAKCYAKITYRICVGEDETFNEIYGPGSQLPRG